MFVSSISPSLAFGIGQGSVVNSLAFFPTLMLRIERRAAAEKAQWRADQREEAKNSFRKALETDSGNPQIQRARQYLR